MRFKNNYGTKTLLVFVLLNTVAYISGLLRVTHPLLGLNIFQYLEKLGYYYENHTVQTSDGYLLSVQRIPCGRRVDCSKNGPPVYFMHGMTSSAMDWISFGPNSSLPLMLAEKGFDVWLGNNRGSTWSRRHIMLNPDKDAEFWDFSYYEMGIYDLPALIDYILNATNYKKLTYVGYSQGSTQLFVLGSEKPEYGDKIKLACLISPVTNMYNITNNFIRLLNNSYEAFNWLTRTFDIHKIMERNSFAVRLYYGIAYSNPYLFHLLEELTGYLIGANTEQMDKRFSASNWPAGVSVKQLKHYIQGVKTGIFGRFDYGKDKNLKDYNQTSVPTFDVTKIFMPIAVYYSPKDSMVNLKVMEETLSKIPNIVEKYLVSEEFDHVDFLSSKNVTNLLYKPVIRLIKEYNKLIIDA